MSELTSITLPASVPFPVTVTSILAREGENVAKHSTIFKYLYWDYQDDPNSKEEVPPKIRVERIGTLESPVEGEIETINVSLHQEIAHSAIELCAIKEPCTHTVQYGGLCALCGKAVEDEKDYTGYNYEDRATISMSHDNTGLKISLDEATKIEHNTTERLSKEKKLILVVDLDQTVIHATVDPTVGEWQKDPSNPNYPAVKDVKTFCLEEESIVPAGWSGPRFAPTKCWYYVKVRPGLAEFLEEISKLYELHIYTMATRNYALAIAKIIDPDAKYFGDRILSRDESGSLTHKNLKRLFPVDQSMVVIIDDRGDVWQWESNLIKVVPYEFFVGIGDINSSFLPKKNGQLTGPTKKRKSIARLEAAELEKNNKNSDSDNQIDEEGESSQDSSSPVDRILELGGGEGNTELLIEQSITRNQSIEQQQHDRPLAKLQHNLEQLHQQHHNGTHHDSNSRSSSPSSSDKEEEGSEDDDDEDDNLLYDDDNELTLLNRALVNIHSEYYKILNGKSVVKSGPRPDLTRIIPQMKSTCLKGVTILFSGIIPLGVNIHSADIVIWSKQFGVEVVNEVYPEVTHVVCRDPANGPGPTFKARVARQTLPNVKIVNPDWLFACLSTWSKVDEEKYLISQNFSTDWEVNQRDIDKYQQALAKRFADINKITDTFETATKDVYDFDEANQEVDDFLANISDDDDEDDDDEEADADAEGEEEGKVPTVDSFIKDIYKTKRARDYESDEDTPPTNGHKKAKTEENGAEVEEDLDELEKELLDGFDDLED